MEKPLPDRCVGKQQSTPPDPAACGEPAALGGMCATDNEAPGTTAPGATERTATTDPFNPESLRLSQDFGATLGVQRALITVPVKKPAREWWVRVHPDPSYRLETAVLELKEDREVYLVDRSLWSGLASESTFAAKLLVTTMNRQGTVFIWPIRMPGPNGNLDDWSESAHQAATMAQNGWVRVQSNMNLGAYEVLTTSADIPEPEWPQEPLRDLLEIAFRGRLIERPDHPVLKRLQGVL